jgi:DNA-binding response OmpR family regulator
MHLRPRVLVVEDDLDTLGLLREILGEHWDVVTARSAGAAVREWVKSRPEAIVLDLRLGRGEDGMDVFHEIRRQIGAKPPTLLISGADEAASTARALGIPVVRKPFTVDRIVDEVAKLIPLVRPAE